MSSSHTSPSRIGVGTVQFGIPYGINNPTGMVAYKDVLQIFEMAYDRGINCIDTARNYGESEAVIGKALSELHLEDAFTICTKLDLPAGFESFDRAEFISAIRTCIETSRATLAKDKLDAVLLHRLDYRTLHDGAGWDVLVELKEKGHIGELGISAASGPTDLDSFYHDGVTTMVQIPYNALDDRWAAADVFDRTRASKLTLVNRSTFLQGLLLMTEDEVSEKLPVAADPHHRWIALCHELGIEPLQLALRYVLSSDDIDCTLIGVDNADQFRQDLELESAPPLDRDIVDRIRATFRSIGEAIVNPALW